MSAVTKRAREFHAMHHSDRPGVTCYDCRMAASWLIEGRERGVPRARRSGEDVEHVTAHDLQRPKFVGRIVQIPGHRGYLRSATPWGIGVHVCTASGVATYLPSDQFSVWGP